jgi:HEAT repeat protein
VRRVLTFAFLLSAISCAPPACTESGERDARKDVKLLVDDDGALAEAARGRLVERGVAAVAVLETGLYAANPPARLRVVRTLAQIQERTGTHEAAPIFAHLVAHDPDLDVREAARKAMEAAISPLH